jgi:hypothetical protein
MADMSAARDELRRLIEQLPEEQVPAVLAEVQRLAGAGQAREWPPPWFGAVTSVRTDTSARVDELLADGFGRADRDRLRHRAITVVPPTPRRGVNTRP